MKFFKYAVDGYGNAASIALPTYGITSTALGLLAGGAITVILGSVCLGVLGLLSIPFFYWSYHQYVLSKKKFEEANQQQIECMVDLIINFYLAQLRQYILNQHILSINQINITDYIKFIKGDIAKLKQNSEGIYSQSFLNLLDTLTEDTSSESFLNQFLGVFSSIKNTSLDHQGQLSIKSCNVEFNSLRAKLSVFFEKENTLISFEPLPYSAKMKEGLTGFSTGFGTAAGGFAGFCNVMVGLGVFAGIAAVPVVGWSLLAAGLLSGCIIAGVYIYIAREKQKQQQIMDHYQTVNSNLNLAMCFKKEKIETKIEKIKLDFIRTQNTQGITIAAGFNNTAIVENRGSNVIPFLQTHSTTGYTPTLFGISPPAPENNSDEFYVEYRKKKK